MLNNSMINTEIFDLLYNYPEERPVNNVLNQLHSDNDYQQASTEENKLSEQYESLNLSDEQRRIINQWVESITAKNAAYSAVVFRMGM